MRAARLSVKFEWSTICLSITFVSIQVRSSSKIQVSSRNPRSVRRQLTVCHAWWLAVIRIVDAESHTKPFTGSFRFCPFEKWLIDQWIYHLPNIPLVKKQSKNQRLLHHPPGLNSPQHVYRHLHCTHINMSAGATIPIHIASLSGSRSMHSRRQNRQRDRQLHCSPTFRSAIIDDTLRTAALFRSYMRAIHIYYI